MRKRKLLLGSLAGALVLTGVAAFVLWPRPRRITEENFARIKQGMTLAEVEAILGPPGDYTTGPVSGSSGLVVDYSELAPPTVIDIKAWADDYGSIALCFDGDGRATGGMEFGPHTRAPRGPFDNLRWRIKRQWHCWFP